MAGSGDPMGSGPHATKFTNTIISIDILCNGDEMKFFRGCISAFIVCSIFWFIIIYFALRAVE